MSGDKRRYPISEEQFNQEVLPIIQASYRGKGRRRLIWTFETLFYAPLFILLGAKYPRKNPQNNNPNTYPFFIIFLLPGHSLCYRRIAAVFFYRNKQKRGVC